jgi:hypothetical protein
MIKKDKKYYFLVGMPRSGNTMLASILNQNKKISVTANSLIATTIWNLHKEKQTNLSFLNFPDHDSYDNITKSVFDLYYKNWDAEVILDRASWGAKNNIEMINLYCPNKPKFIVLLRDVKEILASFIKWSNENENNFLNHETNNASVEEKCEFLMKPEFQIVQEYSAIYNLYNNTDKYDCLFIKYNDLVNNTSQEIEKIYSFLQLENFNHDFNKLDQLSINNIQYNDSVVGNNLHKVKEDGIYFSEYSAEDYLPESIIKKYSNLNFWDTEEKTLTSV